MSTFDENQLGTRMHIDKIKNVYGEYINDSSYVYIPCDFGKAIAILKKPELHQNDELRQGIINSKNALYKGGPLIIKLIFDKFDPTHTLNNAKFNFSGVAVTCVIGQTIESVLGSELSYAFTVFRPFYDNLIFVNYTGDYCEYYDNGVLKEFGSLNKGKKEGLWIENYSNGKIMSIANYNNNKLNGLYSEWYENGNKSEECTYVNDVKVGFRISWNENGEKEFAGYCDASSIFIQ